MIKTIRAGLVALALAGLAGPLQASQNSCIMPNTGTVSGLTLVNLITLCNNSLLTLYSGSSAPGSPVTYQLWIDTSSTPVAVKQFDGSQWVQVWQVDATGHLIIHPIGGGFGTINSATTTDLGSVPQAVKTIAAVASPITSFGSSAVVGSLHVLLFPGIVTITASSNILTPGSANIVTASGDVAMAFYAGSGVWRIIDYTPASSSPLGAAYSFLGNNSGAAASRSDITIPGLTAKSTPIGADIAMIADSAAGNALKKITLTSLLGLIAKQPYIARATASFTTDSTSTTATVYYYTLTGGGGGGGGANGTSSAGSGGGAGGTCIGTFTGVGPSVSVTITLGAGGNSGPSGSNGGTGVSSTKAATGMTTVTATGGGGGGGNSSSVSSAGTGGTCTTGTGVKVIVGGSGLIGNPGTGATLSGGAGGASYWGGGAANSNNALSCNGVTALAFGSGGGGACLGSNGGAGAGGAGEVTWNSIQ